MFFAALSKQFAPLILVERLVLEVIHLFVACFWIFITHQMFKDSLVFLFFPLPLENTFVC